MGIKDKECVLNLSIKKLVLVACIVMMVSGCVGNWGKKPTPRVDSDEYSD
jgi:hypothetical protein